MKFLQTLLLVFVAASFARGADDCRLAAGWQPDEPSRTYSPGNLYEYLDGGAEGFLIFGFVRLEHQTCVKGKDSLTLDISEMSGADAAWGLFASRRDPRQPVKPIGMGGEILTNRASFAKGNFYVEITATPGADYRATLGTFVTALEKRLQGRSTPPQALAWFPRGSTSTRLVPQSVLGLRPLKRGFVAEYPHGQAFIVTETSPQSAAAVFETLRKRFAGASPVKVADEAFQASDRYPGGVVLCRKGRSLGGSAQVPDRAQAISLAKALAARLP